jgi:hypothetical protein
MKIGGWKTRSVFERYAIVSQSDIRDAMSKLEAGQQRDDAEAARDKKAGLDYGAGRGSRTPKTRRSADFESAASASSAIPALPAST